MSLVSLILFVPLLLRAPGPESIVVYITTSDVVDVARMIARDEGYDVRDTRSYSFDLLDCPEGKPLLKGYTSIGFDIKGEARHLISISRTTGQALDMNTCEIFDYPDLRPFQEQILRISKARKKTPEELAVDAGCESPIVLTTPASEVPR